MRSPLSHKSLDNLILRISLTWSAWQIRNVTLSVVIWLELELIYLEWMNWASRRFRTRTDRRSVNFWTFLPWCNRKLGRPYCRAEVVLRCRPSTGQCRRGWRKSSSIFEAFRWWMIRPNRSSVWRDAVHRILGRRCKTERRDLCLVACWARPNRCRNSLGARRTNDWSIPLSRRRPQPGPLDSWNRRCNDRWLRLGRCQTVGWTTRWVAWNRCACGWHSTVQSGTEWPSDQSGRRPQRTKRADWDWFSGCNPTTNPAVSWVKQLI